MDYFKIENDFVILNLNPKLYSLETVYSAAYQMLDDAFIIFEGDPDIEIIVRITPKDFASSSDEAKETLAKEFFNKLINYSYYQINANKKEVLRALLLRKSFNDISLEGTDPVATSSSDFNASQETNSADANFDGVSSNSSLNQESILDDFNDEDLELDDADLEFDDPDGIAVPWDEKHDASSDEK